MKLKRQAGKPITRSKIEKPVLSEAKRSRMARKSKM